MTQLHLIQKQLRASASPEDAKVLVRFFKTGQGEYGEGDQFLGVRVPKIRALLKMDSAEIPVDEMMDSPWHEERLLAVLLLVRRFQKANEETQQQIVEFYLDRSHRINNWDLVDLSAPQIIGGWLLSRPRGLLDDLAASDLLWKRRMAIVSTLTFIRNNDLSDTFRLSEKLLGDRHDLMHKACGWMLREAGKRRQELLEKFLWAHIHRMPRTTLRYAIEKFPEAERQRFLSA